MLALKMIDFQRQLIKLCLSLNVEYLINQLHVAKVMSCYELMELLYRLIDPNDKNSIYRNGSGKNARSENLGINTVVSSKSKK